MSDIKQEMVHGVFWSAVEKYSSTLVSIIISMILARLLTPDEYGVVAIAYVIIAFLQIFCTMGIGPAIIQRNDLEKDDINNIFTFSLILGFVLALILYLSSGLIADYYENEALINVCHILSIVLFFSAANMVPNALMAKHKRFKEIAQRTLILQLISSVLAIIAAYKGAGVYALLISPVLTAIGIFIFNWRFYPMGLPKVPSLEPLKRIFSYSFYQLAFEIINYFSRNLDKLIIGKKLSSSDLGYYDKSYTLMQLPLNNVTAVINPVLQPILSVLQDDMSEMAEKYNKIIRIVSTISFPIGIILFFSAADVILVMFGDQWVNSIPVFKILALSIPTQMILSTSGAIWQSCNATKYLFWIGFVNSCIVIAGFIISVNIWGTIESVGCAWTLASYITFTNTYFIMYKRVLHSSIWLMLKQLINPFLNAIVLVVVYIIYSLLPLKFPCLLNLVIELALGALITLTYLHITGRFNVISFAKNKLNNKK